MTIEQLLDAMDENLRKAFRDVIYKIRDEAQLDYITKMIEKGDLNEAFRAANLDVASFREWERQFERAFETGANYTANRIPLIQTATGYRMNFQFNIRNPVAESHLRSHSGKFIKEVMDDTRQVIREHLRYGMERGLNPRTVALDLVGRVNAQTGHREGGTIGLTSSQAEWVRNYEEELRSSNPLRALERELRDARFDSSVRKAAREKKPIPDALITKMVMAYKNSALKFRANAIGRTEAMAALHGSQDEALNQAMSAGIIKTNALSFIWRTARDKKVRDSHATMDGQKVKNGEMFITGSGAQLRYPGDPAGPASEIINCRCWREPKIDFLAGVK
jgi:hypothetical protein